jgi:hypothetical protein
VDASSILKSPAMANSSLMANSSRVEPRSVTGSSELDFGIAGGSAREQVQMMKALHGVGTDQRGVPVTIGE